MRSRSFVWLTVLMLGVLFVAGGVFYFFFHSNSGTGTNQTTNSNSPTETDGRGLPVAPPKRMNAATDPATRALEDLRGIGPTEEPEDHAAVSRRILEARAKGQARLASLREKAKPIRFEQNSIRYEVLPEVYALPNKAFDKLDGVTVVQKSYGYVFFRSTNGEAPPDDALPVVLSSEQRLGIVTGNVLIKFSEGNYAQDFANEFQLQVTRSFDHLKLAYFKSGRDRAPQLLELLAQLKSDGRVSDAKLEITEKAYATK